MNGTSSRIVIVGAGIVGASIAYHLARQGQRVIVVEQAHPAAGATGSSFGWISEGVPEGAPDAFLRREIVADWVRLTQEIPELWVNWSGAGDAKPRQSASVLRRGDGAGAGARAAR
ncbi:NAD(P)/FAD-dependent oxidoreductase [Serratia marcescens]|uniref:NAD(P)/FAD-dependent oxidoreductase n=1 Tax=Serratia marcescens TaxID=615 RepID=UPI003F82735C